MGLWLFLVSIVGGSSGILIGGAVSDRIVKRAGLQARYDFCDWIFVLPVSFDDNDFFF